MTWLRVPGPEGLVKRVRAGARGPEPEGLSQRDWARGNGPGGKDGCTDIETYKRTNKYPLHSTGHCPFGAAALKSNVLYLSVRVVCRHAYMPSYFLIFFPVRILAMMW